MHMPNHTASKKIAEKNLWEDLPLQIKNKKTTWHKPLQCPAACRSIGAKDCAALFIMKSSGCRSEGLGSKAVNPRGRSLRWNRAGVVNAIPCCTFSFESWRLFCQARIKVIKWNFYCKVQGMWCKQGSCRENNSKLMKFLTRQFLSLN